VLSISQRYLTASFLALLLLTSFSAKASDLDILISDDSRNFTPIEIENLENKKIEAIRDGNKDIMLTLGMMYRDGANVDKDLNQAIEWFKSSAENGKVEAMVELAKLYAKTSNEKNDGGKKAVRLLEKAAKLGDAEAFYQLGLIYEFGEGQEQSDERAFDYYRLAAKLEHLNAHVKLAIAYQFGYGTEKSIRLAIESLRFVQKNTEDEQIKEYASQILGSTYYDFAMQQQDSVKKFKLLQLAAENDFADAETAIADAYKTGEGVEQDAFAALEWYEKAASKDNVYAMEAIGYLYMDAIGDIQRDYKKAFEWFDKAAYLGGVNAAYYIGYMYYNGLGVEKDKLKAKEWFDKSESLRKKRDSSIKSTQRNNAR
jgi:TPR repeat protein